MHSIPYLGFEIQLLMEQQLVDGRGDEPDGEAGRQHNPKRQVFSKTHKGD